MPVFFLPQHFFHDSAMTMLTLLNPDDMHFTAIMLIDSIRDGGFDVAL
jgi:hypothetical protein